MKSKAYERWDDILNSILKEQFLKKHEAVCGLYGGVCCRKKIYVYIDIYIYVYIDIWNIYDTHTYIYEEKDFDLGRKTKCNFLFAKYL